MVKSEKNKDRERKIMIIDDEDLILSVYQRFFKKDFQVEVAKNGVEASLKIVEFHPDLVILDLKMPKIDGFAVAEKIKDNPETQNIKILVSSAFIDIEAERRLKAIGVDYTTNKPVDLVKLRNTVNRLLKK